MSHIISSSIFSTNCFADTIISDFGKIMEISNLGIMEINSVARIITITITVSIIIISISIIVFTIIIIVVVVVLISVIAIIDLIGGVGVISNINRIIIVLNLITFVITTLYIAAMYIILQKSNSTQPKLIPTSFSYLE